MTAKMQPPEALEKLFHEPNRLAIMSALCAAETEMSFVELRDACGLTDGNLNRHLAVLERDGAIRIRKRFVRRKPLTTIQLSDLGLHRFGQYLDALESVLRDAKSRLAEEHPQRMARTIHRGAMPDAL